MVRCLAPFVGVGLPLQDERMSRNSLLAAAMWVAAVLWVGYISSPTSPRSNGGDTVKLVHGWVWGWRLRRGPRRGAARPLHSSWRGTSISRPLIYKKQVAGR